MRRGDSSGFTIVELMVAMVILMIISAIAIPHYLSALQRGHEAVAVSYLRQVQTAEEAYRLANQSYTGSFADLQPYVSAGLIVPDSPQFAGGFVSVAYADPPPPQGKSGSSPGKGGTTPPGQGGTPPGQSGGASGGISSGGSSSGSAPSGGSSSSSSSSSPDSKVYSMYIFYLTSTDGIHWNCSAEPIRDRLSNRFYYTDETNTIHVSIGTVADGASPQL